MRFSDTFAAGKRAEQEVIEVLKKHTKHVYSNVRVDTLLTKSGVTEIDVLAAIADILLVVEVKNVKRIEGAVSHSYWNLTGFEQGQAYSTLNVFTQNRIHVRSLKDAWQSLRQITPTVVSVVVVPNGCDISPTLAEFGILTVQQFAEQVAEMAYSSEKAKYGYALDYILLNGNNIIERPDF